MVGLSNASSKVNLGWTCWRFSHDWIRIAATKRFENTTFGSEQNAFFEIFRLYAIPGEGIVEDL